MDKKEIEVSVQPHSSSLMYYIIHYRTKKKFNLFNFWKNLVEVWDGAYLTYNQPVMFSDFDQAVKYANKLKANPSLIDEHYKKQDEIYRKAEERRNKRKEGRDKSYNS